MRRAVERMLVAVVVGLMAGVLPARAADAPPLTARQIMDRVDERDDGDNAIIDMEMQLVDKNGGQRQRQIRVFRKDKGKDTLSTMFVRGPADVAGIGFLTVDYRDPGKDDDQWLYLPALRRVKRLAGVDKSGKFMGSDFNLSDMVSLPLERFDYALLEDGEVDGHAVWRVEVVPKTREIARDNGYAKYVLSVRKDLFLIVAADNIVHGSQDTKKMVVKKVEQIDGVWTPTLIEMETRQGGKVKHRTVMDQRKVRFNQDVSETLFTARQLERGL